MVSGAILAICGGVAVVSGLVVFLITFGLSRFQRRHIPRGGVSFVVCTLKLKLTQIKTFKYQHTLGLLQQCLGHLCKRHKGYEVSNSGEQGLFVFDDVNKAADFAMATQIELLNLAFADDGIWRAGFDQAGRVVFKGPRLAVAVIRGTPEAVLETGWLSPRKVQYGGPLLAKAYALSSLIHGGMIAADPETFADVESHLTDVKATVQRMGPYKLGHAEPTVIVCFQPHRLSGRRFAPLTEPATVRQPRSSIRQILENRGASSTPLGEQHTFNIDRLERLCKECGEIPVHVYQQAVLKCMVDQVASSKTFDYNKYAPLLQMSEGGLTWEQFSPYCPEGLQGSALLVELGVAVTRLHRRSIGHRVSDPSESSGMIVSPKSIQDPTSLSTVLAQSTQPKREKRGSSKSNQISPMPTSSEPAAEPRQPAEPRQRVEPRRPNPLCPFVLPASPTYPGQPEFNAQLQQAQDTRKERLQEATEQATVRQASPDFAPTVTCATKQEEKQEKAMLSNSVKFSPDCTESPKRASPARHTSPARGVGNSKSRASSLRARKNSKMELQFDNLVPDPSQAPDGPIGRIRKRSSTSPAERPMVTRITSIDSRQPRLEANANQQHPLSPPMPLNNFNIPTRRTPWPTGSYGHRLYESCRSCCFSIRMYFVIVLLQAVAVPMVLVYLGMQANSSLMEVCHKSLNDISIAVATLSYEVNISTEGDNDTLALPRPDNDTLLALHVPDVEVEMQNAMYASTSLLTAAQIIAALCGVAGCIAGLVFIVSIRRAVRAVSQELANGLSMLTNEPFSFNSTADSRVTELSDLIWSWRLFKMLLLEVRNYIPHSFFIRRDLRTPSAPTPIPVVDAPATPTNSAPNLLSESVFPRRRRMGSSSNHDQSPIPSQQPSEKEDGGFGKQDSSLYAESGSSFSSKRGPRCSLSAVRRVSRALPADSLCDENGHTVKLKKNASDISDEGVASPQGSLATSPSTGILRTKYKKSLDDSTRNKKRRSTVFSNLLSEGEGGTRSLSPNWWSLVSKMGTLRRGFNSPTRHKQSEAQKAAPKYITVAVINILDFHTLFEAEPREATTLHSILVAEALKAASATGGAIEHLLGDRIFMTWNAVSHCAGHSVAAVKSCLQLVETFMEAVRESFDHGIVGSAQLTVGIASGRAVCLDMGCAGLRQFSTVGPLVNLAYLLERLNKVYDTCILTNCTLKEETTDMYIYLGVGCVQFSKWSEEPVPLYSLMDEKELGDEDEWMYMLEKGTENDPFLMWNQSFELLRKGRHKAAKAEFEKYLESIKDTDDDETRIPDTIMDRFQARFKEDHEAPFVDMVIDLH